MELGFLVYVDCGGVINHWELTTADVKVVLTP